MDGEEAWSKPTSRPSMRASSRWSTPTAMDESVLSGNIVRVVENAVPRGIARVQSRRRLPARRVPTWKPPPIRWRRRRSSMRLPRRCTESRAIAHQARDPEGAQPDIARRHQRDLRGPEPASREHERRAARMRPGNRAERVGGHGARGADGRTAWIRPAPQGGGEVDLMAMLQRLRQPRMGQQGAPRRCRRDCRWADPVPDAGARPAAHGHGQALSMRRWSAVADDAGSGGSHGRSRRRPVRRTAHPGDA